MGNFILLVPNHVGGSGAKEYTFRRVKIYISNQWKTIPVQVQFHASTIHRHLSKEKI
jgi:hypothetical protein